MLHFAYLIGQLGVLLGDGLSEASASSNFYYA